MNIKQIRKCYDICDELEKQGLESCFINAIRGTLSVKQTLWDRENPTPVLRSTGSMSCDVFDDKKGTIARLVKDFEFDDGGNARLPFEPIIRPFNEMVNHANAMSLSWELTMRELPNHPHFIALNFV